MCLQKSGLTQCLTTVFALFAILANMDPKTMSELIAKKKKLGTYLYGRRLKIRSERFETARFDG